MFGVAPPHGGSSHTPDSALRGRGGGGSDVCRGGGFNIEPPHGGSSRTGVSRLQENAHP